MSQVTKYLFLVSFINILNQRPTKYEFSLSVPVYHAIQAKITLHINSSLPLAVYVPSQEELCGTRCRLSENTMNLGKEKRFCKNMLTWQCKAAIFAKLQTFSSQGI